MTTATASTGTARSQILQLVCGLVERMTVTRRAVAKLLGLAESTLRSWCARGLELTRGIFLPRQGRPRRDAGRLERNDIIATIHGTDGKVTLRELKDAYPQVGRAQLLGLLHRYRRLRRKARRRGLQVLSWTQPGSVWAMDFTELSGGIEDLGRHLLVVRDLASGNTLTATPCSSPDACHAVAVLARLFVEHGAPLVLKCDNGSAFIAGRTRALLDAWQVLPLYSPPGTPSYNGACEAGCGSIKHRAESLASCRGAAAAVSLDELVAAQLQANQQPVDRRAGALSRQQTWRQRPRIGDHLRRSVAHRVAHWRSVLRREQGLAPDAPLPHAQQASIDRFAIGQALREHDLLMTRSR